LRKGGGEEAKNFPKKNFFEGSLFRQNLGFDPKGKALTQQEEKVFLHGGGEKTQEGSRKREEILKKREITALG